MSRPSPAPLPPMRDASRLGAGLRRYLLIATLLVLALMGWGAVYLVQSLDLDLSIPTLPAAADAPEPAPGTAP